MILDPCCMYLNKVEWHQKRILLKNLRWVLQKLVIWAVLMQGWEEHNSPLLRRGSWCHRRSM